MKYAAAPGGDSPESPPRSTPADYQFIDTVKKPMTRRVRVNFKTPKTRRKS